MGSPHNVCDPPLSPKDGVIDLWLPPSPKTEVKHQTRLKAVRKRARFG